MSSLTFWKECLWTSLKLIGIGLIFVAVFSLFVIMPAIEKYNEHIKNQNFNRRAVEKGFAEYTTDSGTFHWINKDVEYLINGTNN